MSDEYGNEWWRRYGFNSEADAVASVVQSGDGGDGAARPVAAPRPDWARSDGSARQNAQFPGYPRATPVAATRQATGPGSGRGPGTGRGPGVPNPNGVGPGYPGFKPPRPTWQPEWMRQRRIQEPAGLGQGELHSMQGWNRLAPSQQQGYENMIDDRQNAGQDVAMDDVTALMKKLTPGQTAATPRWMRY